MRLPLLVVAVGAATALAACGRKEEAEAPVASRDATVPAEQSAATPLMAKRRAGLWQQSVSMTGTDAVQTSRICLDDATDAKLSWWGSQASRDLCSKSQIAHLPDGGWRFSSECDMGSGGVVTTAGVAQGNFNKHYEVKAESSTQGAALEMMNRTQAMTVVADWLGACPAGMKGGDIELPGGVKINVLDTSPSTPPAPR